MILKQIDFGRILALPLATMALIAGLVVADRPRPALAQEPAAAARPEQSLGAALKNVSTKYRFREVYSLKDGETLAGEVGQTRNAFKETLVMTVDVPKGAPVKSERTRQVIYTERPAMLSGSNRVAAVVRRFETLRFDPAPQGVDAAKNPPLDGLVVYVVKGPAGEQILSLTDGRSVTDFEFGVATTVPTLLNFAELLPQTPLRIGETWAITRNASRMLLGRGQVQSTKLLGTLISVQPSASNPKDYIAILGISGNVTTDLGICSLNLQYEFDFTEGTARVDDLPVIGARGQDTIISASGAITKMTFAQLEVSDVDGSDGRLKQVFDRKLIFERQVTGRQNPVNIPASPPTPSKENSWLVFEDPLNRFTMLHPPSFRPQLTDDNMVLFVTADKEPDFIRLDADSLNVKPEQLRKDLEAEWKADGFQVFAVSEGWLDDPAWKNRRVYFVEAALQAKDVGNGKRGHFDAFHIQFPQNTPVLAESMTYSEQSTQFRALVEQILQTIEMKAQAKAPAAKPADAPKAP
ncbi:MAG: hypothetical protein ACKO0V_24680 [bacterium]